MVGKVLFVHTNYPAQFRFLVKEYLAKGWEVSFASHTCKNKPLPEINYIQFKEDAGGNKHSKLDAVERRSLQSFVDLLGEKRKGLNPDLIYVHTGWGLGVFLKEIFPKAKIIAYSEWWFNLASDDFQFDKNSKYIKHTDESRLRMLLRNQGFTYEMLRADTIIAPTQWQKKQLPPELRARCEVVFDGIDQTMFGPGDGDDEDQLGLDIERDQFLITYATRGLEPYRGFPEFAEAMVSVLKRHPNWTLAIAGKDQPSYFSSGKVRYGQVAMEGFKRAGVNRQVRMLGRLSLNKYRDLLRRSDLHCYFTRPYVLSWSCLEAAMVGCPMIASDLQPVREFLQNGRHLTLVDHISPELHERVEETAIRAEQDLRDCGRMELKRMIWNQREELRISIERRACLKKHMTIAEQTLAKASFS